MSDMETGSSPNADTGLDRPDIHTPRLLLRRPQMGDRDAIVGIVGDWKVARRLARVPHPYNMADAEIFIKQVVPHEWVWAITKRGANDMIGAVGLTPEDGGRTAELGYWLSPEHWGRGIATEAAKAALNFGFDTLFLPHLTSGYFDENPASGRVLEKLGFTVTGHRTRNCRALNKDVPARDMRIEAPGSINRLKIQSMPSYTTLEGS